MYALKEAILIKEKCPDTDVTVFYMDMRAFGKGYHRYYQQAGRGQQFCGFALSPEPWSCSYNPLFLGKQGDPIAAAERLYSVLQFTHEYYGGHALRALRSLVVLLHSTGHAFNVRDLRMCLCSDEALAYVESMARSSAAKHEVAMQMREVGRDRFIPDSAYTRLI